MFINVMNQKYRVGLTLRGRKKGLEQESNHSSWHRDVVSTEGFAGPRAPHCFHPPEGPTGESSKWWDRLPQKGPWAPNWRVFFAERWKEHCDKACLGGDFQNRRVGFFGNVAGKGLNAFCDRVYEPKRADCWYSIICKVYTFYRVYEYLGTCLAN